MDLPPAGRGGANRKCSIFHCSGHDLPRTIAMLRRGGEESPTCGSARRPLWPPCYYGTDIDSGENLIASHHSVEEIAGISLRVDSLGYLSLEHTRALAGREMGFCTACFGGGYPTSVPQSGEKDRFEYKIPPQATIKARRL